MFSGTLPAADRVAGFKGSVAPARERGTPRFPADRMRLQGGHSPMDVVARIGMFDSMRPDRRMMEARLLSGATLAADEVAFQSLFPFSLKTSPRRHGDAEKRKTSKTCA